MLVSDAQAETSDRQLLDKINGSCNGSVAESVGGQTEKKKKKKSKHEMRKR